MVQELAVALVAAMTVNHLLLEQLLGLDAAFAASRRLGVAFGLGLAVTAVVLVVVPVSVLLERLLLRPADLGGLRLLFAVVTVASVTALEGAVLRRLNPAAWQRYGVFGPLVTINSAVLAVAVTAGAGEAGWLVSVAAAAGAGIGYAITVTVLAALRERLARGDAPAPLRGAPLALISLGIMAMTLNGFVGFAGF